VKFNLVILGLFFIVSLASSALAVRPNLRRAKAQASRWSTSRTIYFVNMMGSIGDERRKLLRRMDGPNETVSDGKIAMICKFQNRCIFQIIAAELLVIVMIAIVHEVGR
jgi:hypothetical protein